MKKTLFMLIVMILTGIGLTAAQSRKVTGEVISAEDKEPIVGATVTVKGTKIQTVTDVDGLFTISTPPPTLKG